MDLDTLWERVNDAINTIIRRDESTETGDLLPPCVEGTKMLFRLHSARSSSEFFEGSPASGSAPNAAITWQ